MKRSVSRRWFVNTAGVVLLILVVFIAALSYMARTYAYNSFSSSLRGRAEELLNVLSSSSGGYKTSAEFSARTRQYIENFPDKNTMEIMAINRSGKVYVTSTGFPPNPEEDMPDYQMALRGGGYGYKVWRMQTTDEKVMAVTRVVRDEQGNLLGSVRYLVSLDYMDRQLFLINTILIGIGVLIMLFIVLSGVYFVRSIVTPVREVTVIAQQIAHGDFKVRIEKNKDDEIGRLCESINDMAAELSKTEIMKNDFISSVSHELRTPLTSIKGWAETLQNETEPNTLKRGMQVIGREAHRLSGIVEELLDFSRLQNGRIKVKFQRADILSELDEAVYMFTDRAATEGKKLNYIEQLSLPAIYADANRIKQVFVNILDNAIKYTKKGGTITVSARVVEGLVRIRVSDTGVGIPAQHVAKVKEKFYKANQMVGGSGIGLAVAEEIMEMHSGTLSIDSRENLGTKVIVSLPTIAYLEEHPDFQLSEEMKEFLEKQSHKAPSEE